LPNANNAQYIMQNADSLHLYKRQEHCRKADETVHCSVTVFTG